MEAQTLAVEASNPSRLTRADLKEMAKLIKRDQNAASQLVGTGILSRLIAVANDADCRRWLLRTLYGISKHRGADYLPAVYADIIALVLPILRNGADGVDAGTCLGILHACIQDGATAEFVDAGSLDDLANFLTGSHSKRLTKQALSCMQVLVREELYTLAGQRYESLLVPHVAAVYGAMASHVASSSVQWRALDLLTGLADVDGLQDTSVQCMATVKLAMDTHPGDRIVQQCGCRLLSHLSGFLPSPAPPTPVFVGMILRAMSAEPNSCLLQTEALDALTDLAARTGSTLIVQACAKRARIAMASHNCEFVQTAGSSMLEAIGQPAIPPAFVTVYDSEDDDGITLASPYKRCCA